MPEEPRVGEVIEACTADFVAQCYELYRSPPLGVLVKSRFGSGVGETGGDDCLYGLVAQVLTTGLEPGRRAIARGRDELNEEEVYRANPQLTKLLTSEFNVLVIGYRQDGRIFQHLPPDPARIHGFVYLCSPEEVKQFSRRFDFLDLILEARLEIPALELVIASLRRMSLVYGLEKRAFLIAAGKELAALLSADYARLKAILKGLKDDAT